MPSIVSVLHTTLKVHAVAHNNVVLITAVKNVMALTSELLFEACFEKSFIVLAPKK